MSKQQIMKLLEVAQEPPKHGKWSRFCLEERVSKDTVFHWRKKLGLPVREKMNVG